VTIRRARLVSICRSRARIVGEIAESGGDSAAVITRAFFGKEMRPSQDRTGGCRWSRHGEQQDTFEETATW
jgi:hypothetical protein